MASEINTNPDGSYMSEDQILADLPNRVQGTESVALIRSNFTPHPDADREELFYVACARETFGRWIRNSYGLWREDNPHAIANPPANEEGIIDHPLHPDNLSGRIIDRFVAWLQGQDPC